MFKATSFKTFLSLYSAYTFTCIPFADAFIQSSLQLGKARKYDFPRLSLNTC